MWAAKVVTVEKYFKKSTFDKIIHLHFQVSLQLFLIIQKNIQLTDFQFIIYYSQLKYLHLLPNFISIFS